MTTPQPDKKEESWKKEFEKKFFVEGDEGTADCNLCGHDHTESGTNWRYDDEMYGDRIKNFIKEKVKESKLEVLEKMRHGLDSLGDPELNTIINAYSVIKSLREEIEKGEL